MTFTAFGRYLRVYFDPEDQSPWWIRAIFIEYGHRING